MILRYLYLLFSTPCLIAGFSANFRYQLMNAHRNSLWVLQIACLCACLPFTSVLASGDLRTVILSNAAAPGTSADVKFNFFGTPLINNSGQTAFVGNLK